MTRQQFDGVVEKVGTRVGIVLPFDPGTAWGQKERYSVTGTVNGKAARGALAQEGGRFFLPLGPAWLRDNGMAVGSAAAVELAPEGPQSDLLAEDISSALAAEPEAKEYFDGLATFYRKNYLRWIEGAKRPETRKARIEEMIGFLKQGKRERR